MMDATKYAPGYYPVPAGYDSWVKKDHIEKAPAWCSVDLRDGNQALIVPMSLEEKLEFFQMLVKIGFKEIEVGFPAASETEYEFLRTLIEKNMIPEDVTVQVLTQCRDHIIRKTFEAVKGAPRAVIHFYNSTSVAQREQVFHKSKEEIKQIATDGAKLVKQLSEEYEGNFLFEYSPESFTGTEVDYAVDVCNAVLDIMQPTPDRPMIINLPVTVETTDILKIFTFHERLARGAADREALQVPRDVLAQIMHRHAFVAVVELGEQPGVTQDHRAHVAERRVDPLRAAGERVLDVGEQPGPALASAPHGHAGAAGLAHHVEGVVRAPDVAVAEHGNIQRRDELADAAPVGVPAVVLGGGPGVQGDGRAALLLGDMAGFEEGLMVVVDADADLRGDRDISRRAHRDDPLQQFAEQVGLPRQRRSAAATGDLGHRAAEVQVHVIGHMLVDDDPRGLFHDGRVHPVQLQGADLLARSEMAQAQCLGIARDQRAGGDHLRHVQPVRAVALADHAERPVGHAGHRRQDDRGRHGDRPQPHRIHRHRRIRARRRVRARIKVVRLVRRLDHGLGIGGLRHGFFPLISQCGLYPVCIATLCCIAARRHSL